MESQLVDATWGLVVATAFLVVAASIPLLRDAADRRERRRRTSSHLVPDMNILRSRLEGTSDGFTDIRSVSNEAIEQQIDFTQADLVMLDDMVDEGERPSLLFANEMYITRHLVTQARSELRRAHRLAGKTGANDIRARDDALSRVRRLYKAALMSLDSAERLLPSKVRTIKGESFWDRFARVSLERESEAERSFVVLREPKR